MGYFSGYDSRKEVASEVTKPGRIVREFFKEGHRFHGQEWNGSTVYGTPEDATDATTEFLGMTMARGEDLEHREVGNVVTIARFWSGLNLWTVAEVQYDDWYCIAAGLQSKGERFITVFLINRMKTNYGVEWGYKPVSETMGPCELTCPPKFLDMVTDPGGYATAWRERVREYRASRKLTRKATIGDVYQMRGLGAGITSLRISQITPKMRVVSNKGDVYRGSRALLARRGTFLFNYNIRTGENHDLYMALVESKVLV